MKKPDDQTEWELLYQLAQEDHKALRVLFASEDITLPVGYFHAQQAVEKYLKAVMSFHVIAFPYTHNLLTLSDILLAQKHRLPLEQSRLKILNPFAVKQRYDKPPETSANRAEIQEMVDLIANWCKQSIYG